VKIENMQKSNITLWVLLLQTGLLGLIGGVLSGFIDWTKEDRLTDKKFQYELFQDVIAIQNAQERKNRIEFLYKTGIIEPNVIPIEMDSVIKIIGYQKGQADRVASLGVLGAIRLFYLSEGRVPVNIDQLINLMKIKNVLEYFNGDIHYKATAPTTFELRFYGSDGVLYTDDDRIYNFENLNIE